MKNKDFTADINLKLIDIFFQVKKRDELIQKEKLDPIAVHSSQMAAMAQFGMGPMGHMLHPHHHSLPHL